MLHPDPARHPSLILVEALDLGQVSGRGALHLETLLRKKHSQRTESNVACGWLWMRRQGGLSTKHRVLNWV